MSKEIPILFSTPMVEAILAGRKTMTRRVVKFNEEQYNEYGNLCYSIKGNGTQKAASNQEKDDLNDSFFGILDYCPYGNPGDSLWVRETWVNLGHNNCQDGKEQENYVIYKASENGKECEKNTEGWRWRPSIFLKKKDCRIWLEKTNTRVERLHDISEEDAIAEGVEQNRDGSWHDYLEPRRLWHDSAKASFQSLWMKINGEKSWHANPWLWCNNFKVLSTTGKPESIMTLSELFYGQE